jgi:hypothetical protein
MGVVRRERWAAPYLWAAVLWAVLLLGGGGVVRALEEGTVVYIVTMKQAAASYKRLDLERFGGSSVALAEYRYSLRSILLFANIGVSRHSLVIDISIFEKMEIRTSLNSRNIIIIVLLEHFVIFM